MFFENILNQLSLAFQAATWKSKLWSLRSNLTPARKFRYLLALLKIMKHC